MYITVVVWIQRKISRTNDLSLISTKPVPKTKNERTASLLTNFENQDPFWPKISNFLI